MSERQVAEVFHPGEYIADEMKARGWSIETVCEECSITRRTAEELLSGHRRVTPLYGYCLGRGFGTSAEVWVNLQKAFDNGTPEQRRKALEALSESARREKGVENADE